jgi:uncharacterized protein YjbI with pentapeptide repeats
MSDTGQYDREGIGESLASHDVSLEAVDPSVLRLSPEQRAEQDVSDDEVRRTFLAVARHGEPEDKDLRNADLPALNLDRAVLEGTNNAPLDLRGATIESLSLEFATVKFPLLLDGATVGHCWFDNTRFEGRFSASETTFTGEIDGFETVFADNAAFDDATFEAPADFDETIFEDDVFFDGATFEAPAEFRAAEFYGDSNVLDDNASFTDVRFTAEVDFFQAEFGFTTFEGTAFEADAVFQEIDFAGDAVFTDCTFEGLADFDEIEFGEDAFFERTEFHGEAHFRGSEFVGGERALEEDVTFEDARFHETADFTLAQFRFVDFSGATLGGDAAFKETELTGDADFTGVRFEGTANFDEVTVDGDAEFVDCEFTTLCTFRGAMFTGNSDHEGAAVRFDGAVFGDRAEFQTAEFGSVTFADATFRGPLSFADCTVSGSIDFSPADVEGDGYVDFTRAAIRDGQIVQPADGWMRCDLTLSSVGNIDLAAERQRDQRELLDYFRFCRTEFDEFADYPFDFSAHRDYLDRNAWVLHEFDDPDGNRDYAVEMTPEVIEMTYLKAKHSASEVGNMKAAGEFRVKRQQYSREKNMEVVTDGSVGFFPRLKNFGRAAENYFLGLTCGHGMRPIRIAILFIVTPMFFAPLYAFGGSTFRTSAGQTSISAVLAGQDLATLYEAIHFSYISYTTIGYGNIGPQGALARLLAGTEAYFSTILAALLVYALVKRSEL